MDTHLAIDHLVYATPDLWSTVADIDARFGVAPVPGGAHVGRGTYNALLGLGGHTYLEVIGPDPAQSDPELPRPFGIDLLDAPRLVAWCVAPRRPLVETVGIARSVGFDTGPIVSMSRQRPDGVVLEWSLTTPLLPEADGGVLPFFIDWGASPHPTLDLPVGGILVELDLVHPAPRTIDLVLTALSEPTSLGDDIPLVRVNGGDRPGLSARIQSARGSLVLD